MALYKYIKQDNSLRKKTITFFSYLILTAGTLLLFWSFYPVLSFEIYSRLFISRDIIAPVPSAQAATPASVSNSVLGSHSGFTNNVRDFTQASLWFPKAEKRARNSQKRQFSIKEFKLSISRLNIEKARVIVGGNNLNQGLIHYQPKSLPGEYGNIAIFGHSTLPQLYDPKNYKSIFTYLPSLEKGDKIRLDIEDITYEYEVKEMFVVKPEQISVLDPKYDASYITLVTCVPPGTYWNRLIVRAKLTTLPAKL